MAPGWKVYDEPRTVLLISLTLTATVRGTCDGHSHFVNENKNDTQTLSQESTLTQLAHGRARNMGGLERLEPDHCSIPAAGTATVPTGNTALGRRAREAQRG